MPSKTQVLETTIADLRMDAQELVNKLQELRDALAKGAAENAELAKKLAETERNYKYVSENATTYRKELDAVHEFLSMLPNAPAKTQGQYETPVPLLVRVALIVARASGANG